MLHIALWEPEIPPNTGNIARLCAATGTPLHLIGRLGFRLDERSLRRAGLDYWDAVELHQHATFADFEDFLHRSPHAPREESVTRSVSPTLHCLSAHADRRYTEIAFQPSDCLLFGAETRGLPPEVLERYREQSFTIPILSGKVRSLNLATAAGIVLYEGLRRRPAWLVKSRPEIFVPRLHLLCIPRIDRRTIFPTYLSSIIHHPQCEALPICETLPLAANVAKNSANHVLSILCRK